MADFNTLDPAQQLAAARQVLVDLPGVLGPREVAPVYMDGIEIDTLRAAIEEADLQTSGRQNQSSRFWATPARLQEDDPLRDVMEIDLAVPRLINQIAFELAHFPHRAVVEYSATPTGVWTPLQDAFGRDIVIETIDSNPPILSQNANQNLLHPQHYGAGHWLAQDIKVLPTEISRVRVVLTRPNGGLPPTDTQGNLVPYSLGVRAFVVGYEIDSRDDIPARALLPGSTTTHAPIATTRDLLGSTVSYAERENPAANLLAGGIWRSGPQPVPYAVVNLYVDVRDTLGGPTVVERFFIEPVTSGCSLNLYYTTEEPHRDREDPWDLVQWTPVGRDFAARRGYMRFDPTLASYFKFEFTDLAPEPYDAIQPVVRQVRLFPSNLVNHDPITRSGNNGGSGTATNGALDGILRFNDNDFPVTHGLTDLSRGFSPTEVFYSKDPAAAARLRDLSAAYNYLPWQGGTQAPHWPGTQNHPYAVAEVLHDQRVAFYVTLSNVTPYRLDYGFEEDTDQYLEYFFDDESFDLNTGWIQTPGDVATPLPDGGPWIIVSKTLPSRSNVRGVQFATTQSPPRQLLPDDDFTSGVVDPTVKDAEGNPVTKWLTFANNEAQPDFQVSNEFNTDIGTTVSVKRAGSTETAPVIKPDSTWVEIGKRYKTYNGITGRDLLYSDLARRETPEEAARIGGIYSIESVTPSPGARVYAAARVISKVDQGEPLWIQIYDPFGDGGLGKVVAEASATVTANRIVEWDVSYDPSANTVLNTKTWDEVEATHPTYQSMVGDTYAVLAARQGEQISQSFVVRLAQKGLPNATWNVDTLSLFEESILWEFSNDDGMNWYPAAGIRNNPRGVLIFPEPDDVAVATTYAAIEGRDPSTGAPTYGQLGPSYGDLEHSRWVAAPDHRRLRWRVSCAAPGQHVNALSIRPWYTSTGRGQMAHEGVNIAGPNQALYDHYQPIETDPRFRMWHKPVPTDWYFSYRQFTLVHSNPYVPTKTLPLSALGQALVVPRVAYRPDTDTLGDALVIPVGGPTPDPNPPAPLEVLPEAFILPGSP